MKTKKTTFLAFILAGILAGTVCFAETTSYDGITSAGTALCSSTPPYDVSSDLNLKPNLATVSSSSSFLSSDFT